jgi:hypothetical protein
MMYLKQSTALSVKLGQYVDATDGFTAETAIADLTITLSKNGGALAARSSATAIAHDASGWYTVPLDATDTATLGDLLIFGRSPTVGHRPVHIRATVLAANVYDSLIGGGDLLSVNVEQVNGDVDVPPKLEGMSDGTIFGTVSTGSTASSVVTNLTEGTNDHYKGAMIVYQTGALAGQRLRITAYNGTTKALTVTNQTADIAANGDLFFIS